MAPSPLRSPPLLALLLVTVLIGCEGTAPNETSPGHGDIVDSNPADATLQTAPGPPVAHAPIEQTPVEWTTGLGHLGVHTLAWHPMDHAAVPRNQEFELVVQLERDGQPALGAQLQVTGWMPEHSHGMVQIPLVEELGGGRYLVSGMLLHMRGRWQLRFLVVVAGSVETVTFDLEL